MKIGNVIGALALLPTGVTPASGTVTKTVVPSLTQTCDLYGWSFDRDPTGLRVRAGPSARARIVGRLPPLVVPKNDTAFAPAFRITGAKDGWLRIAEANDNYNNGTPRRTYAGSGWVHGSMARVAVQGSKGRDAPAFAGRVLVDTGEDWLSERGRVTAVTGCSGKWARVRYILTRAAVRGPIAGEAWFTNICGEQRTTCDGVGTNQ